MGITKQGNIYNGEKCERCKRFMHKALLPIHDYYGVSNWLCVNCGPIPLKEYDRLMKDIPKNFKSQATRKQISKFRKLLKKIFKDQTHDN